MYKSEENFESNPKSHEENEFLEENVEDSDESEEN